MAVNIKFLFIFFSFTISVKCTYPPVGDEVLPGSVLLPATRRGRYLANIVRRQAVDGTGIKFNKDADRMNAEAKKKVDVLSEELLPYIIAEQERRTTLHKRIMTAIQNGEKGVTIAEIRNKPPVIIRKGMLYRCPANRAPKEPDGSGVLMCEDDIVPTQIMYDSCLSAEDKELYNAENKYFFCNRHKIEGPDLPRNGTTVIGCAPVERTSLNYTVSKCTLEDTDDVVVHYRYYPDRTYKFVTELDPDREVCDHWNPCQIGYIYSLPSPDLAMPASELWHDFYYEQIVPAVPEDSIEESVHPSVKSYQTSGRKVKIPEGYTFAGVKLKDNSGSVRKLNDRHISTRQSSPSHRRSGEVTTINIVLSFERWKPIYFGMYFAVLKHHSGKEKLIKFLVLAPGASYVIPTSVECMHGQRMNSSLIPYKCSRCRILGIMIRSIDENVYNVENTRFRTREFSNRQGKPQQYIEVDLEALKPQEFGDYFAIIQNGDGVEERVKICTIQYTENVVKTTRLSLALEVGGHYDRTMNYTCDDCEMTDILCNGDSVLSAGRVSIIQVSKMISFNFPRFEDANSCVYMGFFKRKTKVYKKILAVLDNSSVSIKDVLVIPPPKEGEQFEQDIEYTCEDCSVERVFVNGMRLETQTRRNGGGPVAFYVTTPSTVSIRITEYKPAFEGIYQAVFMVGSDTVTKTILEIRDTNDQSDIPTSAAPEQETTAAATETEATTAGDAATSEAVGASSEAPTAGSDAPAETTAPPA